MTHARSIQCPSCGYDLSAAQSTSGACPECGHQFDAGSLDAREHAEVSLALGLIGLGTLAGVLAAAARSTSSYTSEPNDGIFGFGGTHALLLALLPFLAVVYGAISLASLTGKDARARWWPALIAVAFAVCAVVRLSAGPYPGYPGAATWLQPRGYRAVAEWGLLFGQGAFMATAALTIGRVAQRLGSRRLQRRVLFVVIAAGVLMVVALATHLHDLFALPPGNTAPGNPPPPTFTRTILFTETLQFLLAIVWWLSWPVLGLLALHARTLWKASGYARP